MKALRVLVHRLARQLTILEEDNSPFPSDAVSLSRLVACLDLPEGEKRAQAMLALAERFPQLAEEDAACLTGADWQILYVHLHDTRRPSMNYHLYVPRYTNFVLATLTAIARLDRQNATVHVARLAASTTSRQIQDAAHACLAELKQQAAFADSRDNLLRPSSTLTTAPDTLLRPAQGSGNSVGSDELLRAGSTPDADPLSFSREPDAFDHLTSEPAIDSPSSDASPDTSQSR